MSPLALVAPVLWVLAWLAPHANGQSNPVFVDDSTLAADVFAGIPAMLAGDNEAEAVRLLQRLLLEEADRLIVSRADSTLYESVRNRVHEVLLNDDDLLRRYRAAESDAAARLLDAGDVQLVEHAYLLTRPGAEAALQLAAGHLAAARFESCRITLEQLSDHPDLTDGDLGARAAALWSTLAAYLDRDGVRDQARAWAQRAGLPDTPIEPVTWPEALTERVHASHVAADTFSLEELVASPLCASQLRPDQTVEPAPTVTRPGRAIRSYEFPVLYPTVVGDTVYTNDGLWISAWDRFTLSQKWRTKPRGADRQRRALETIFSSERLRLDRSRETEESNLVTPAGRLLLAATGVVSGGDRIGDPRLHALDARTGSVLWSTYIDELDEALGQSSTRGPAMIEGDIAVVAVRKIDKARRFASAFLVGIDLADGSARWVRLCGSAGWLSYVGRGEWSDWPTIHEGIVYRVDELGVIAAVEAATGRFRWVRQLPGTESRLPSSRLPWASNQPVVREGSLITLSPNRQHLVELDLTSGALLGQRSTREFIGANRHPPGYMVAQGERLYLVSPDRVATIPLDDAMQGGVRVSPQFPAPGIMGRVVFGERTVLAPVLTGVERLDAATVQRQRPVVLDAPGNLVAIGSQLLAMDNEGVHSYLVWEDAAEVLRERVDTNPTDTDAAITFAELAARAGRFESVLGPVDLALEALDAQPEDASRRESEKRLYQLLLALARLEEGRCPIEVLDAGASRMESVAVSPDERATHLLLRAALMVRLERPEDAVADLNLVLSDPELARAAWQEVSGGSQIRAERQAMRQLDALLRDAGLGVYEEAARLARTELASLESLGTAPPGAFEALARSYPRSPEAARAWLRAAEAHDREGAGLAASRSLARGIQVAGDNHARGINTQPDVIGELLGRRILHYVETGRLQAASRALDARRRTWPDVDLTLGDEPLDLRSVESMLAERAASRTRLATLGDAISPDAGLLRGWVLMRALDRRDALTMRDGIVMHSATEIALWRSAETDAGMTQAWSFPFERRPALVRHDLDRVLVFEPTAQVGVLRSIATADGRQAWQSVEIARALAEAPGAPNAALPERFDSPLDGRVDPSDLLVAIDETTVVFATRSGRVVALDQSSGQVVWSKRTEAQRVHDIAAGEGVLAIIGVLTPQNQDNAGETVALILDLVTGEELSRRMPGHGAAGGEARWVHITPGSMRMTIGLSRGLISLALPGGETEWVLTDPAVAETRGAWSVADRLFVDNTLGRLALVDARLGAVLDESVWTLNRDRPIDTMLVPHPNGAERLVVVSPAGFAALNPRTGGLIATDGVGPHGNIAQPALGKDRVVIAERDPLPGTSGAYRLHLVDAESGRALETQAIQLASRPRRVGVLDGRILLSTSDSTVVLRTE